MDKDFKLHNGNLIPSLAYGTWLISEENAPECVKNAIEAGYRHIDTAKVYKNEKGVGKGIKLSGVKREDIYITTKIPAEYKSYKKAKKSINESLEALGVDYLDLILIHCPQPWMLYKTPIRFDKGNIQVWKAMEEALEEGKVKAIGVSNFSVRDLENIINNSNIKPMVNQIYCCIGNTPIDVIKYCQQNDIIVESYSPLGHGRELQNEKLKEFADKYGVSVAQLCIKYTLQLDTISIPKASSKEHIIANTKLDFEISKEDMIELLKMNKKDYGDHSFWPILKRE